MNYGKEKATILFAAITLAIISNILNYKVLSPIVHNDELGYLTKAAAIAGYRMDMANDYFAGYSIVISPAFIIGQEPFSIWFVIKIINTTLFLCTFFYCGLFAGNYYQK
ncbi:hypothetical protein [Archaeoglobus sp.]|uniref:hypothetical protein n=1 Tax=Archaeoglobus sp. TaxID=1872626 RepID=UPI0024AAF5C2|nr:hypothetical protein [Archaeoglobus sp.]MDI3498290.1 hypothetical protein [Archaeoglobus sp.]